MKFKLNKTDLWLNFKDKTLLLDSLLNEYGLSMKKRDDLNILKTSKEIEDILDEIFEYLNRFKELN